MSAIQGGKLHNLIGALIVAGGLSSASIVSAGATGDFKVTGSNYVNDVVTVSGTVNHGAIQSNKTVVVEITYDYSFVAEKTETIPGETSIIRTFVPGRCVTGPNFNGCFHPHTGDPSGVNEEKWVGSYIEETSTTEPITVTQKFNGTSGMVAVTEPTVERGRLNPKGKITGYNWTSTQSIVENADLVDPSLVPQGYTVVEVTVNGVSYMAYLEDASGAPIADTVVYGELPK